MAARHICHPDQPARRVRVRDYGNRWISNGPPGPGGACAGNCRDRLVFRGQRSDPSYRGIRSSTDGGRAQVRRREYFSLMILGLASPSPWPTARSTLWRWLFWGFSSDSWARMFYTGAPRFTFGIGDGIRIERSGSAPASPRTRSTSSMSASGASHER